MGLFGKSKPSDPKEQVNEWCKKIRKEGYNLDRQINAIKREEAKVTRSLKEAAKKGESNIIMNVLKQVEQENGFETEMAASEMVDDDDNLLDGFMEGFSEEKEEEKDKLDDKAGTSAN